MKLTIITTEQFMDVLELSRIVSKEESQASVTYNLIYRGNQAVLINTVVESYLIR